MDLGSLRRQRLLAAVICVISSFVLTIQLISPTSVVVSVDGTTTEISEFAGVFTYQDVLVLVAAAVLLGGSGMYLIGDWRRSQTRLDIDADERPGRPSASSHRNSATPTAAGTTPIAAGPNARTNVEPTDARLEEWETTAEQLSNNEREVYEAVLGADGTRPQSEIVEETDLSKATVSRTLDNLETKNLVERKRRGMGNVITLL
ncbi:helix-turn-helix transcriptional regulator [Halorussus amylolyticus]|uniref:helix-turn-helix transcriptional regulator n=1 Tax=Halorussus amylolyticus TaxID=1126242 RepID=UPI001043A1D8|nr:MarR family transcriptional regulator [Halorussus amylolyticus]